MSSGLTRHSAKLSVSNDLDLAVKQLFNKTKISYAVMTRAAKGVFISDRNTSGNIPAFSVTDVKDTTGAGDAYAAGFLTGIVENRNTIECHRLGAATAALTIQKVGARVGLPNRREVQEFISENKDAF